MKKSGIAWLVFILLVLGCKPEPEKVQYKLTDDQLARLVLDIQLSESILPELSKEKRDSLKDLFYLRFSDIYKLSEPELKAEIEKLEADQEKMREIVNKAKFISDSIR
jgi:hypothetical protein